MDSSNLEQKIAIIKAYATYCIHGSRGWAHNAGVPPNGKMGSCNLSRIDEFLFRGWGGGWGRGMTLKNAKPVSYNYKL